MEAIFELIAAIFGALISGVFALLQIIFELIALALQILFVALTKGITAAKEQYALRKKEREVQKEEEKNLVMPLVEEPTATAVKPTPPSTSSRYSKIFALVIFFGGIAGIGLWIRHHLIQQQLVGLTQSQAQTLVNNIAEQIRTDKVPAPQPGNLPDKDSWQQPLQLFIDKLPFGTLIVVRSFGPDRQRGTIDDILAIGEAHVPLKQAAGKLANRGLNALKDRAAKLLQRDDQPPPPDDKKADQ